MKTLRFNREIARKVYLRDFPILQKDKHKLELLLLRGELLTRNQLFIREWEKLQSDPYQHEKRLAFIKRWHVNPTDGLYWNPANDPVAQVIDADWRAGTISIRVDTRFSKRRIAAEIEKILGKWQADFKEEIERTLEIRDEGRFPHWFGESDSYEKLPILQPVKEGKTHPDSDDYRKALSVWDLKEVQKKTWSEIERELSSDKSNRHLTNLREAARNWRRLAEKLIKDGVPTLAPFPQK